MFPESKSNPSKVLTRFRSMMAKKATEEKSEATRGRSVRYGKQPSPQHKVQGGAASAAQRKK